MKILIADDHGIVRGGMKLLIDRQPDLMVCGEAGNPAEAFRELARSKPDLVLTDLKMPGLDGMALLQKIRAESPDVEVVMLTAHGSIDNAVTAIVRSATYYCVRLLMSEGPDAKIEGAIREDMAQRRANIASHSRAIEHAYAQAPTPPPAAPAEVTPNDYADE